MPHRAADALKRSERWLAARSVSLSAGRIGFALVVLLAVFWKGLQTGQMVRDAEAVEQALDRNADVLQLARHYRDSLSKVSALAIARSDSVRASRNAVRSRIRLSMSPTDSAVTVLSNDSVTGRIDSVVVDVPMPVVSVIRASDSLHMVDSLTIHALRVKDVASDSVIATQAERIALLERQNAVEGKRSFWKGVKVGVVAATVAIVGVVAAVR